MRTDIIQLGSVFCAHRTPGSIGKLEDDLVLQIIDLSQPAVIGYVVTIHERPDMLQIFAVDRVEDAVGSYQLHSTLYVDINYSSTLAVLKRQKRKRIYHLGKVLHTHICALCT